VVTDLHDPDFLVTDDYADTGGWIDVWHASATEDDPSIARIQRKYLAPILDRYNTHAELLEALECLAGYCEARMETDPSAPREHAKLARAAITKAKGNDGH
jgi:hypothetical protein